MKVALITWTRFGSFGGIGSFLDVLRAALEHQSVQAIICLPPPLSHISTNGMDISNTWCHTAFEPRSDIDDTVVESFRRDFAAFIAREHVDIIHSHNLHVPLSPGILETIEQVAFSSKIPHILTVHDVSFYLGAEKILRTIHVDCLVTQSMYNVARIWEVCERKAMLLPLGIDFSIFTPDEKHEPNTIACLGRLVPKKGVLEGVEIVAELAQDNLGIHLILSNRSLMERRENDIISVIDRDFANLPNLRITYVGDSLSSMLSVYRQTAITLVLPQSSEGFGLIPLESLACGRPVIVTPTGGMSEWLHTLPGVLCVERTKPAISQAVRQVLQEWQEWYNAALTARNILKRQYDIKYVAQQHIKLYTDILAHFKAAIPSELDEMIS